MSEGTPQRRTLMVNAAYSAGTPIPAPAASPMLPSTSPVPAADRPEQHRPGGTEPYAAMDPEQTQSYRQIPSSVQTRPTPSAGQYPSGSSVESAAPVSAPTPSSSALQEKDKIIFELLHLVRMKDSELLNLTEELSLLRREMQELSAEVKLYRRGFQSEVVVSRQGTLPDAAGETESRGPPTIPAGGGQSSRSEPIGVVGSYNPHPAMYQGTSGAVTTSGFVEEQRFPVAGNGVIISGGSAYAFHHQPEGVYHTSHLQDNQNGQVQATPFATPSQLSALHVDLDASRMTVEPLGDGRTPPRGQPVVVYQPYPNGNGGGQPTSTRGHATATFGMHPRPTPITPNRDEVMRMVEDHERQIQRVMDGVENAKLRVAHRTARGKETDEYLLDAGSFRVRDSKTPIIAQAVGQRRLTPEAIKAVDLSNLTPRRQVELYGAVTRKATPGPATYSPLWNRLATPKRTASPRRK